MHSVIQVAGSLLILVPFVLVQLGRMTSKSRIYLWLNLVGSTVLAVDAAIGGQWGFLLLEGVWAIVSLIALIRPRGQAGDVGGHQPTAVSVASVSVEVSAGEMGISTVTPTATTWHPILAAVEGPTGCWQLVDASGAAYGQIELRRVMNGTDKRYRAVYRGQVLGWAVSLRGACERVHGAYVSGLHRSDPTNQRRLRHPMSS